MPRTKRRTVKKSTADLNMTANMSVNGTMANQPKNIKEIMDEFESEKGNIEENYSRLYDEFRNSVENSFLMLKLTMASSLKTNLYDHINESNGKKSNATTASQGAERPSRAVTKTTATKTAGPRSAQSQTRNMLVAKHRSGTRSEVRGPLTDKNDSSKFRTPVNQKPLSALGMITPKVNVNEAMSVMRRPNHGEIALSMTGSPLMISSVSRDDMATVSVPLANGNVLSILPNVGNAMDVSFDEQTKNELLVLKGNIEGLLKINKLK